MSNPWKQRLKSWRRAALQRYHRLVHGFGVDDLSRALATLGLAAGDTVLVHSAYDAFPGFSGKPTDMIAALQRAVGPTGHLLMPTMAFTSTAVDYVRSGSVLDVRRTPSRMGLLTELFRRMPGVVRSAHPTHPVAVSGPDAAAICRDHYAAGTPCGRPSPFVQLLDRDGKILLLGTDIDVLTFYHAVEELLESRFPMSPFTTEVFTARVRDAEGVERESRLRLFEPAMSRRRNLRILERELRAAGAFPGTRLGAAPVTLLSARAVLAAVERLADRGIHCYE